ncbi:MAG: hypothetical protein ACI9OD_001126 [Limisphaerales bacterium]|jgi:hypothetical protein
MKYLALLIPLILLAHPARSGTIVDSKLLTSLRNYYTNNTRLAAVRAELEVFEEFRDRIPAISIWIGKRTSPLSTLVSIGIEPSGEKSLLEYANSVLNCERRRTRRDLHIKLVEYARLRQVLEIGNEQMSWIETLATNLESRSQFHPLHAKLMAIQNRRDDHRNHLMTMTNDLATMEVSIRRLLGDSNHLIGEYELQLSRPTKPFVADKNLLALASLRNPDLKVANALVRFAGPTPNAIRALLVARAEEIDSQLPESMAGLTSIMDSSERLARSLREERLIRQEEAIALARAGVESGRITLADLISHHLELAGSRIRYLNALAAHHRALSELLFICGIDSVESLRILMTKHKGTD